MASVRTASSPCSSIRDTAAWLSAAFVAAFFRSRSPAVDIHLTLLKLAYFGKFSYKGNNASQRERGEDDGTEALSRRAMGHRTHRFALPPDGARPPPIR